MESQHAAMQPSLNYARRITWRRVWLGLVGALCVYGLYCWAWKPSRAERLTIRGNSSTLHRTVIVPTLDSPMSSGKNIVWCASFQAAWDQLRTAGAGTIQQPPGLIGAEAMTDRLNHSPILLTDLPPTCYAAAGMAQRGIVPTIQSVMHQRFPVCTL